MPRPRCGGGAGRRQRRYGTSTRSGHDNNDWNALAKRLTVASMDGTIRQYDVASFGDPTQASAMPAEPIVTFRAGINPVQVTTPIASDGRSDDLFVVSRGAREIRVFTYKGDPIGLLKDSRLVDPVFVAVGANGAGFGGAGPGLTLNARVMRAFSPCSITTARSCTITACASIR